MNVKFYKIDGCATFYVEGYAVPNNAVEITEQEYNQYRIKENKHNIKQFVLDSPQQYNLPSLDNIDEIEWYRKHELNDMMIELNKKISDLNIELQILQNKLSNAQELDDLLDSLALYMEDTE